MHLLLKILVFGMIANKTEDPGQDSVAYIVCPAKMYLLRLKKGPFDLLPHKKIFFSV